MLDGGAVGCFDVPYTLSACEQCAMNERPGSQGGEHVADEGFRHLVIALTESGCRDALASWIAETLAPMIRESAPAPDEGSYYRATVQRAIWRAMLGRGHSEEQAHAVIQSVTAWLWMTDNPSDSD